MMPAASEREREDEDRGSAHVAEPSRSYQMWRGSGDEQAKAKLCCVEIDEVAVAFGPPA